MTTEKQSPNALQQLLQAQKTLAAKRREVKRLREALATQEREAETAAAEWAKIEEKRMQREDLLAQQAIGKATEQQVTDCTEAYDAEATTFFDRDEKLQEAKAGLVRLIERAEAEAAPLDKMRRDALRIYLTERMEDLGREYLAEARGVMAKFDTIRGLAEMLKAEGVLTAPMYVFTGGQLSIPCFGLECMKDQHAFNDPAYLTARHATHREVFAAMQRESQALRALGVQLGTDVSPADMAG